MDQFEDQFLAENPESLGLNFEEDPKFFDPEAAHEADFLHPAPVEESPSTRTIRSVCTSAKWVPFRS